VKRLLISFELYKIVEDEGFYQIDGLNDTKFFLNYFSDSLLKDNIRTYMNVYLNSEEPINRLDTKNLQNLVRWWFEKSEGQSRVIGDSEGLKLLDAVIGNSIALSAFEKGASIYEAYELTDDIDVQFRKKINDSLKFIEQADALSNRVKSFYCELHDDLKSIRKIAVKIHDFKSKIEQDGDDF
jgi:hypothetical protein